MVRASALQLVDQGFIPLVESYQKTLKMASAASLLGAWHLGEVVENKSASLLVVFLGKALNGMPHRYVEDRWPINLKKRQLPSECGLLVQSIVIQFTFS